MGNLRRFSMRRFQDRNKTAESKLREATIEAKENVLTVKGEKKTESDDDREVLYRGIASPTEFKITGQAQVAPFGCRAYPAIANGRLYLRSSTWLFCLDLAKPSA